MKTNPMAGPKALQASLESFGPETAWMGANPGGRSGPAPAGALQRKYDGYTTEEGPSGEAAGRRARGDEDDDYVPRRGAPAMSRLRPARMVRSLARSTAGRVVLGVMAMVLTSVMAVGFVATRQQLLHDPRFTIASSDEIEAAGNVHVPRSQVLGIFGADLERNIFRVDLAERRADLERLPWVEHASVMRLLPNRLRVQIKERVPVAFVRQGTQIGLVDAHGVLLDMPAEDAGNPNYSFPVLTGIVAADPLSVRAARMAIYQDFVKQLDSPQEHLSRNVSEVDVSDPEDVRALVTTGGSDVLVHFGDSQYLERYRAFESRLPAWRAQYPKLTAADMRYDGQIVLEMGKDGAGTESVSAAEAQPASTPDIPHPIRDDKAVVSRPPDKAVVSAPLNHAAKAGVRRVSVKAPVTGKGKAESRSDGRSKANDKLFAELAAARKKNAGAQGSSKATGKTSLRPGASR